MHRFSRKFGCVAALTIAAVLATISVTAVTNSSTAALPIPFTQKTVKVSNGYQQGQCSIVINAHDFSGNNTGYIDAQSQTNLLGGLVSSTKIYCKATNAANAFVDDFTYTGSGATLLNTRKNGSYGLSPTYKICIVMTATLYTGGTAVSSACV